MRLSTALVLLFFATASQGQQLIHESFNRVNSVNDELNPVVSPDGNTIYFTIANHPENVGAKKDAGDIWFTEWQGTQWSAPKPVPHLNDRAYNAITGFSSDGQSVFLVGHYDATGNTARTQGISISKFESGRWSSPQNIFIPYFQNRSTFLCGMLSDDESVFVFSAETYGTHGVDDLYVSIKEDGKWSEPKNLGSAINTQFQEVTPSLSTDGKTLYFSSNGRKGIGSFDVFSCSRLDDTWTNWTTPVNLGGEINSAGRELFFREYNGFSIFTSTNNSDGYGHIKIHKSNDEPVVKNGPVGDDPVVGQKDTTNSLPVILASADTVVSVVEPIRAQPDVYPAVVSIHGAVKNSKTGEQLVANIHFSGSVQGKFTVGSNADGYKVSLPSSENYAIKIDAPGYISILEKLDINSYEMKDLEMNFMLQPVEIGTIVNLKSVLFAQAKTDLLPESYDELDLVVSFLMENPKIKIELSGHTDNRGVHGDNVRLSQQRVNVVRAYLVEKGIDGKRITGKGHGGTNPIASNETEETRMMNRRVEFIIRKF
jgi:outer membrane protein OmpA-like peptidoglycan-associated protein